MALQGTTFEIRLQAASDRIELEEVAEALGVPDALDALVIDDDPEVLEAARMQLEAFAYGVHAVNRALAALTVIGKKTPDLVLCDLRLGGADTGIETIHLLRERIPSLPAILMTGETAPEELSDVDASDLTILHTLRYNRAGAGAINATCGASGEARQSKEQGSPEQE